MVVKRFSCYELNNCPKKMDSFITIVFLLISLVLVFAGFRELISKLAAVTARKAS